MRVISLKRTVRKSSNTSSKTVKPRKQGATRQRGVYPSDELVPLQFRMTQKLVDAFKQEALKRHLKLNGLLRACFDALLRRGNRG